MLQLRGVKAPRIGSLHMEMIPAFYFDADRLQALADEHREAYRAAHPFPHVVIDGLFPPDVLRLLVDEFPRPDDIAWNMHGPGPTRRADDPRLEKLQTSDERLFPAFTRHVMGQLNSHGFLRFLESLTGVTGLIPDSAFNSCGLHSTGLGGKLMVHIDADRHSLGRRFHQRINAIVYLNTDWMEEYGGHLELWDFETRRCAQRVLPVANRLVVFDTGTRSLHGHPHPLTCPEGRRRNSLAAYFYVLERPHDDTYTGFQNDAGWVATTPDDFAVMHAPKERLIRAVKQVTPPILIDLYRRLIGTSRRPRA